MRRDHATCEVNAGEREAAQKKTQHATPPPVPPLRMRITDALLNDVGAVGSSELRRPILGSPPLPPPLAAHHATAEAARTALGQPAGYVTALAAEKEQTTTGRSLLQPYDANGKPRQGTLTAEQRGFDDATQQTNNEADLARI